MKNRWIALSLLGGALAFAVVLAAAADEPSSSGAGPDDVPADPSSAVTDQPTTAPQDESYPVAETKPGPVASTLPRDPASDRAGGDDPPVQPGDVGREEGSPTTLLPVPVHADDRPFGPLEPDIDKTVPPPRD